MLVLAFPLWAVASWSAWPSGVSAQADSRSELEVLVLRSTSRSTSEHAEEIDAALLHALGHVAGIEAPTVPPVDFAEAKLAVGCSDSSRACLSAIAELLEVDAIVLRSLKRSGPERFVLTLTYFDATSRDAPSEEQVEVKPPRVGEGLVAAVPGQVRRLFGIPEPVAPVAPPPRPEAPAPSPQKEALPPLNTMAVPELEPARPPHLDDPAGVGSGEARVRPWTWATLAAGTLALGASATFWYLARQDREAYRSSPVGSEAEVDRALQRFEDAERKHDIATKALLPAGGGLLAVGLGLLIWDLTRSGEVEGESPPPGGRVGIAPTSGGVMLSVGGAFGGSGP